MTRDALTFEVSARELVSRFDPNFVYLSRRVGERYAAPRYPVKRLGDLVEGVQYGTSARAHSEPHGVPIVRMNNLQDDDWDFSDRKWVSLSQEELNRYRLEPGDLLVNRTNSKELVGKAGVFREPGEWVFASYLIRMRVDEHGALPEYVALFLSTKAARLQIDRFSRQIIGMANINAAELSELLIPVPPLDVQADFVTRGDQERHKKRHRLARANELISGLGLEISNILALPTDVQDVGLTYGVRLAELLGGKIDALSNRPVRSAEGGYDVPARALGDVAAVDPPSKPPPESADGLVPYIGLPECEASSVREVAWRPSSEVNARRVVQRGDILFARIEPSIFNQKYVLVDEVDIERAYVSTEFYVCRAKGDEVDQLCLYGLLFTPFVFEQVKGRTTGSSGRRRLDRSLFAALHIPWPERSQRERAAQVVRDSRLHASRLAKVAEEEWQAFKDELETRVLGEP